MKNKTQLVAIMNITPDSFFEGSRNTNPAEAIQNALEIEKEGADWIDIGAESTRPGAIPTSADEELRRLLPVLKELKKRISIPFSIDTMKPKVAAAALEAGASMINDVTGFENPEMRRLAAEKKPFICVMHMQGRPQNMQQNPFYEKEIVDSLLDWFKERIDILIKEGVEENKMILDPGIGFGKTIADNLQIIENLPKLKTLGFPVYIGLSRKSFMGKLLHKSASELLSATLALDSLAVHLGADYLRVHDVKEHRDLIDILTAFNRVEGILATK